MTEDTIAIADFLKANPDFLIKNPGILAFVKLPEQTSGNVTSLQDRQLQTMRDKVKALEHKIVEMTRAAVENQSIIENLQIIQRHLLSAKNPADLPDLIIQLIRKHFNVPCVALQMWSLATDAVPSGVNHLASKTDQEKIAQMAAVYCGFAENAPVLSIFSSEEIQPRSMVLIPLRVGISPDVFGCLGLGSPDKDRFTPNLEVDFLNTLSETACAALSRLLPVKV